MKIKCVWEHNGNDSLLYAENCVGAFTRGASVEQALKKMPGEIQSYFEWMGEEIPEVIEPVIVQEKNSDLEIKDADSDVLFETEAQLLTMEEYKKLKQLALRSAADFLALYESIPDKTVSALPVRQDLLRTDPAHSGRNVFAYKECQSVLFWRDWNRCR